MRQSKYSHVTLLIKGIRTTKKIRKWEGKNPFKKLGYEIYITNAKDDEDERAVLLPYSIVFLKAPKVEQLLYEKILKTSDEDAKEKLKNYFKKINLPLINPNKEYDFYFKTQRGDRKEAGKVTTLSTCFMKIYNNEEDKTIKIMYANIQKVRRRKND